MLTEGDKKRLEQSQNVKPVDFKDMTAEEKIEYRHEQSGADAVFTRGQLKN